MPTLDLNQEIEENGENCQELLKRFVDAKLTTDDVANAKSGFGWTPIHCVMKYCQGDGVLDLTKYLVTLHPDCVREKTVVGNLPIQMMPVYRHSSRKQRDQFQIDQMDARLFVMEEYPDGLAEKDYVGDTALHNAVRSESSIIAKAIVERVPETLKIQNNENELPLHQACQVGNFQLVNLLLSVHPHGLHEKDKEGNTPLTIVQGTTLESLVKSYAEKLNLQEINNNEEEEEEGTNKTTQDTKNVIGILQDESESTVKVTVPESKVETVVECQGDENKSKFITIGTNSSTDGVDNDSENLVKDSSESSSPSNNSRKRPRVSLSPSKYEAP